MSHSGQTALSGNIREQLRHAVAHLEHVLPAQAPIRDFVHHNTLHGFQHLEFSEAIAEAKRLTGANGYLPAEKFREFYHQGRVSRQDLAAVLAEDDELRADEIFFSSGKRTLTRGDLCIATLVHPLKPVTACQLNWQVEEMHALTAFQQDVAEESRLHLLEVAGEDEAAAISDLWAACLERLGLEDYILHPEELLDLTPEQAEQMLAELSSGEEEGKFEQPMVHLLVRNETSLLLDELLERVGDDLTLGGLLKALTKYDLQEDVRPLIIRHLASYLDQGMASWHSNDRDKGFYAYWRNSAAEDLAWLFEDVPEWRDELDLLPNDPLDAVIGELTRLDLKRDKWASYLERLALELPGWSGMFLWRHIHPGYEGLDPDQVEMMDYLAVRLVLERIFAQRLCRQLWQVEASLSVIRWYFRRRRSEFYVRHTLFNTRLPEYLTTLAQRLLDHYAVTRDEYQQWKQLADMVWTWRRSPAADRSEGYTVFRSAWPLFRLAQHLGLCAEDIRTLEQGQLEAMFEFMALDGERTGFIWLQAYERNYREQLFRALAANRGRHSARVTVPPAQLVFCMDDREEGIRRHLEEIEPSVETFGAAAHFSVPHNWRGLDDTGVTALAPVIPAPVIPAHEVCEVPRAEAETICRKHVRRHLQLDRARECLLQGGRRGLLLPVLISVGAGLLALLSLLGKVLAPARFATLVNRLRNSYEHLVATQISFVAPNDSPEATPEAPRLGFTDVEQADRVQALLRSMGMTDGFAPLVAIIGHGSRNQNNPHASAYNCGACSGRFSGPNARLVASMANRAEVRSLLAERGIVIPVESRFIGAEHDTCSDTIVWFDEQDLPSHVVPTFEHVRERLGEASRLHAQERCRRFASAPQGLSPDAAFRHVANRAQDISQVRPELGHATNACAFFGRRTMSRGVFFDRRAFLISYDPTRDPDGEILERHLLINGAVGVGISLEYYFSTVDNERYGCSSKVTHNLTGMLGVMEGASSDLRTGLPRQMIEIHEAMRLQVVVEATTETLTRIYNRQPPLQELIGNGWAVLSAMDPESGEISVFHPERGFVAWRGDDAGLPTVKRSADWYGTHTGPVSPALITGVEGTAHG